MTLTKADLIESIQEELNFPKNECYEIVELVIELIKSSLENEEDVLISGFGKFCVKSKDARRGRNPASEQPMMLPARKVVTFKCSGKLRTLINNKN